MTRFPNCSCSEDQLRLVGCDCEACDPVAIISCWPTGKAQGRPATFSCRRSYAEIEARCRYGRDAKVFSVYVAPANPEPFSPEYIRMMSRDG